MGAGPVARILAASALAAALGAGDPARAQEAKICGTHEVARGETLGAIAKSVYGRSNASKLIFEANRALLKSPDLIRRGQVLELPCDPEEAQAGGGSAETPAATASASSAAPSKKHPKDPDAPRPETASPRIDAPAAPAALPAPRGSPPGGAPPKPLAASPPPERAGADIPIVILPDAAGDALAQLRAALAEGAPARLPVYEDAPSAGGIHPVGEALLAAPVAAPGCGRMERLDPEQAALCLRYDWSAPLAARRMVWLVRKGGATATAAGPEALRGARICRPSGMPDGDIAAAGLAPPRAERVAPEAALDCLKLVLSGEAEAASLGAAEAATARRALGAEADGLSEIAALETSVTLHAVSRRDSGEGRAALAALDRGLAILAERPEAAADGAGAAGTAEAQAAAEAAAAQD